MPGAWEAQGFGEDTPQMHSQYIGVGTYARSLTLPPAFATPPPGSSVWLVVERIQRAAKVTAGGALIGQHTGYLSPFEGDVTKHIAGGKLALQIEVNATRHQDFDGLQGEEDLETDGTGLGGWGGLGGHVRLELRGSGALHTPASYALVLRAADKPPRGRLDRQPARAARPRVGLQERDGERVGGGRRPERRHRLRVARYLHGPGQQDRRFGQGAPIESLPLRVAVAVQS